MFGEVCPLSYLLKSPVDACESLRVPANFNRAGFFSMREY